MKLDVSINDLRLSQEINQKLNSLSLNTIEDLWKCKRIYLKENGLTDSEIHQIRIQLQLRSLDLNQKVYKI